MMKKAILLTTLIFCISIPPAHAKFRALLIGIDYHESNPLIPRLGGAVNDVKDMHDLMTRTFGIDPSSIKVLTEKQANRHNILKIFQEWLIEGTESGDIVFFQYSGHGVQVPDPFGTQADDPFKKGKSGDIKLAEAFVPYDTEIDEHDKTVEKLIFDTELHELLKNLSGRKVTLFLDCCHSGGVTRDFRQTKAVSRFLNLPWEPRESRVKATDFTNRGVIIRRKTGQI